MRHINHMCQECSLLSLYNCAYLRNDRNGMLPDQLWLKNRAQHVILKCSLTLGVMYIFSGCQNKQWSLAVFVQADKQVDHHCN